MKKCSIIVALILSFFLGYPNVGVSKSPKGSENPPDGVEILKQNAQVCTSIPTLNEFSAAYNGGSIDGKRKAMHMLEWGLCHMLLSDAIVPVKRLGSRPPYVEIKMKWGDETFIGWTTMNNIEKR
jgi:hypothetical protein